MDESRRPLVSAYRGSPNVAQVSASLRIGAAASLYDDIVRIRSPAPSTGPIRARVGWGRGTDALATAARIGRNMQARRPRRTQVPTQGNAPDFPFPGLFVRAVLLLFIVAMLGLLSPHFSFPTSAIIAGVKRVKRGENEGRRRLYLVRDVGILLLLGQTRHTMNGLLPRRKGKILTLNTD